RLPLGFCCCCWCRWFWEKDSWRGAAHANTHLRQGAAAAYSQAHGEGDGPHHRRWIHRQHPARAAQERWSGDRCGGVGASCSVQVDQEVWWDCGGGDGADVQLRHRNGACCVQRRCCGRAGCPCRWRRDGVCHWQAWGVWRQWRAGGRHKHRQLV
ncbi:hypothetical protein H4S06_003021, partial [Coemansia sp. BCRC 34490]